MNIPPKMKFDADKLRDCFSLEGKWTLGICLQPLTLSAFDLGRVNHFPHALLQEKDAYCLPEGNH